MNGGLTCHAQRRQDRPLDTWLRTSLGLAHDDILAETLPDEWLTMIRCADHIS